MPDDLAVIVQAARGALISAWHIDRDVAAGFGAHEPVLVVGFVPKVAGNISSMLMPTATMPAVFPLTPGAEAGTVEAPDASRMVMGAPAVRSPPLIVNAGQTVDRELGLIGNVITGKRSAGGQQVADNIAGGILIVTGYASGICCGFRGD